MPPTPRHTAVEFISRIRRIGFERVRQSGSHETWRNAETGHSVTVARHGSKVIPVGALHAMIRQAGLTVEAYLEIEP